VVILAEGRELGAWGWGQWALGNGQGARSRERCEVRIEN